MLVTRGGHTFYADEDTFQIQDGDIIESKKHPRALWVAQNGHWQVNGWHVDLQYIGERQPTKEELLTDAAHMPAIARPFWRVMVNLFT